jgi:enoyl-CoA hydratase
MADISADDTIKVVILTGAGKRAFTAGLDLKELGTNNAKLAAATDLDAKSNPVQAVRSCGKPVIGAINGVAITGGFEVALACDIILASRNARFADTHALVGIMPGWGLSQKLSRIIGMSRAKELSFTGQFIDAETALDWGLVNHIYEPDQLMSEALALAGKMCAPDSAFISHYRNLMETGFSMTFETALEHEHAFSTNYNSGVTADEIESRCNSVMSKGRAQYN